MARRNIAFTIVTAALLIGALWSAAVGPQPVMAQHDQHAADAANAWAQDHEFARALAAGMDKMHQEMMTPPTGNADVDFLTTMIRITRARSKWPASFLFMGKIRSAGNSPKRSLQANKQK